MKFYKEKSINGNYFWFKIHEFNITAIYINSRTFFFKNGKYHNSKNAAYIRYDGYKEFYLNNKYYDDVNKFTKQSWRKFVKLQVFL
jgi:hypothetical protein